jgi:CDP-2,3-bis-(O-geranylgeranyl)-sn-glycerol synthase
MLIDLLTAVQLFTPLAGGALLHGVCIRMDWARPLKRPVDHGRTFRGRRLFGDNKTYRGIFAIAAGTAAAFLAQSMVPALQPAALRPLSAASVGVFGFAFGAAAMLGELPNSFLKRQLDIAPGEAGRGAAGILFYVVDQIDFLVGAWIVGALALRPTVSLIAWSAVYVFLMHQVITVIGYALGMRATAR